MRVTVRLRVRVRGVVRVGRRVWFAFNLGPEDIYFNVIGGDEIYL